MQNGFKKSVAKSSNFVRFQFESGKINIFPEKNFLLEIFNWKHTNHIWQLCQKLSAKLSTIWQRSREKGSFYYFLNSKSSMRKSFSAVVEGSFGISAKKINKMLDLFVLFPNGTWCFEFCLGILLFPENVRLDRYKTVWLTLSRNLTRRPFFPFRVRNWKNCIF